MYTAVMYLRTPLWGAVTNTASSWRGIGILIGCLLGVAGPVAAQTTVTGGSDLLTTAHANQLATWLGEGPVTLNRIFAKTPGMNFSNFHSAVDGKGRTFTVLEIDTASAPGPATRIVGGYNPQSWDSHNHYHFSYNDAERNAFLFNLSLGFKLDQKKTTDAYGGTGEFQTRNDATFGPTFGGGYDLHVNSSLNNGQMLPYSYGTDVPLSTGLNVYGTEGFSFISVGRIEVFTVEPGPETPAVPEPGALALFLPALGVVALVRRRRTLWPPDPAP